MAMVGTKALPRTVFFTCNLAEKFQKFQKSQKCSCPPLGNSSQMPRPETSCAEVFYFQFKSVLDEVWPGLCSPKRSAWSPGGNTLPHCQWVHGEGDAEMGLTTTELQPNNAPGETIPKDMGRMNTGLRVTRRAPRRCDSVLSLGGRWASGRKASST